MATRSAIALQRPDGSLRAVYCHWDGYPSHHLPILQAHHNSARAAAALTRPGDISCLRTRSLWDNSPALRDAAGEVLTDSEGYWRHQHDRDAQPLYYHERGEQDVAPRRFADLPALMAWADGCCCEHVYIYRPRHGWEHREISAISTAAPSPMPGCDPAQW
jgi:hypothetical protein